jgi:hypothetical protein
MSHLAKFLGLVYRTYPEFPEISLFEATASLTEFGVIGFFE